ncbi:DUF4258 domain-containing protein [Phreatobacter sp.]|uniref:DUF4258 domain-containing protein n=1 Tax=Phreatobacter sp. TaxID=1966341 RepID=UPI0025F59F83|nr:DUF4258 domain-containing protein [Phreatobacter sp.]
MPSQSPRILEFETNWIRAYAETYMPSDAPFSFRPAQLRATGLSLVDIRNVLRSGLVVFSEKHDGPGARWVVEGHDDDGRRIRVWLEVESSLVRVELRKIEVVASKEDDSDGAA